MDHHLRAVEEFARHFGQPPDKLGLNELGTYQAYLLKVHKLAVGTVVYHVAGLRFFFVRTLKGPEFRDFLPLLSRPLRTLDRRPGRTIIVSAGEQMRDTKTR